jgi:glutamate-1-semialdehyde 2,1-aminomutase
VTAPGLASKVGAAPAANGSNVGLLDERARAAIVDRYKARTGASRQAHERALKSLPAGVNRNIVHQSPYPIFVQIGLGALLIDLDGQRYLDLIGNYTSMILGHSPPAVVAAAQAQVARGTAWAAASPDEAVLAEMILARQGFADGRVRFTASGTEATLMAIRAARAFTGRPLIAKFEGGYHGLNDYAMVSLAPSLDTAGPADAPNSVPAPGVPKAVSDTVVVLPFNNAGAVEAILRKRGKNIAGVIVEPVMGSTGILAPRPGFLEMLRRVTEDLGIVLIFDEVISFRLAYGGAQEYFGVRADLTTLGKIIGGGYPVGAVTGRADIMRMFDPTQPNTVTLSGTFHANPVALAAGIETLKATTAEAIADLNRRARRLHDDMTRLFQRCRTPLQVLTVGSLFNIHAVAGPVEDYRSAAQGNKELLKWLQLALLNEGVLLSPRGMGCLSTAMADEDLAGFLTALERSLIAIGALDRE